jgi:hypothetical protein
MRNCRPKIDASVTSAREAAKFSSNAVVLLVQLFEIALPLFCRNAGGTTGDKRFQRQKSDEPEDPVLDRSKNRCQWRIGSEATVDIPDCQQIILAVASCLKILEVSVCMVEQKQ